MIFQISKQLEFNTFAQVSYFTWLWINKAIHDAENIITKWILLLEFVFFPHFVREGDYDNKIMEDICTWSKVTIEDENKLKKKNK